MMRLCISPFRRVRRIRSSRDFRFGLGTGKRSVGTPYMGPNSKLKSTADQVLLVARFLRAISVLLGFSVAGCMSQGRPAVRQVSEEDALGTFFLMTAMTGGKNGVPDFLATVYPLRSQIVTFAIIGFRRDRGAWPSSEQELLAYAESSPANPPLPKDSVSGYTAQTKQDGSVVYSTLEDRQRGREFTISPAYKVTFPMPSYPFATAGSPPASASRSSTLSFDWGAAIAQALTQAALHSK